MEKGHFYFISAQFYSKYDKDHKLMKNKETVNGIEHSRPCFYAFPDPKYPGIFWCIPISSRVSKFEAIADKKIVNQKKKGLKNPKCNTIRFGKVLGQKRAFLIQNMFPITQKYINSKYIDKNTQNPVTIDKSTEKDILNNARDVLKLVIAGFDHLVFPDILKIRSDLLTELEQEQMEPTQLSFIARLTAAQVENQKGSIK